MKRFALSFIVILFFSAAFSQKLHFIYLQAEPEQPFFAKINDKVYQSTNSGYLILSRLHDSTYAISIGFPANKWPEQRFTVDVKARDHGYTLKNFGEKGWGLYDIESANIQMSSASGTSGMKTEPREVSAFTDILSRAANDPSLKERQVAMKEEKNVTVKEEKAPVLKDDKAVTPNEEKSVTLKEEKSPVVAPVVAKEEVKPSKDSILTKQVESNVSQSNEQVAAKAKDEAPEVKTGDKSESVQEYKRSVVTRKSESSMTDGLHLTFIDEYANGKKDTIRITIPNQKNNLAEVKQPAKEQRKFLDLPEADSIKNVADKKTDSISNAAPAKKVAKTDSASVRTPKKRCAVVAAETDFYKVRKNMAAETNDEAMIAVAKKYFKTKCFSSLQIKNLSTLFLNDAGKYKFFDAAYEYVSDQDNFAELVSELKEDYYINRFKAMLRPA